MGVLPSRQLKHLSKMGKISYWWLALLCFPLLLQGQTTFNHRYHFGFPSAVLTSVLPVDDGYYATGIISDTVFPYETGNIFVKFDTEGVPVYLKTLTDTLISVETWENTLLPTPDGGFLLTGYSFTPVMKALLIKYDADGDTLFTRTYLNPHYPAGEFIRPMAFAETPDGGYVIVNWMGTAVLGNSDVSVLKIDSIGNEQWHKIYGDVFRDIPRSVIVDELGNIIVGAMRLNNNLVAENYVFQVSIFQLDSEGNLQWSYLTSPSTMLRDAANDMVLLDDGSLVIASGDGTEYVHPSVNAVWFKKLIFKLDPNHELEWESEFPEPKESSWTKSTNLIEFSDDSGFLFAGTAPDYSLSEGYDHIKGWLAKISHDGESIWEREYVYLTNKLNAHEIFDIKETSDGGFIFCGQAVDYTNAGTIPQQAWLIKVDEWSCLVPGCYLIDSADESSKVSGFRLAIYPNPAAEYLNFHFRSPDFNKNKGSFSVLDANGRLIREFATDRNDATFILPVHDWAAGVYFLQYREDGQLLATERFVVQR